MGNGRFIGMALAAAIVGFVAVRWLAPRGLPRNAALPTFHRVAPDQPADTSHASDNDATRDGLRNAVLDAAETLSSDPCNELVKARYIRAATQYAQAWLSIAPCVATTTCSDADAARLDRAQQAFGTPLDRRVREAMAKAHETDVFRQGDFPYGVAVLVAAMASDPLIHPRATADAKASAREMRTPAGCAASALH